MSQLIGCKTPLTFEQKGSQPTQCCPRNAELERCSAVDSTDIRSHDGDREWFKEVYELET